MCKRDVECLLLIINVDETGRLMGDITYCMCGMTITLGGPFKASQPILEVFRWNWICSICFWIPKTVTAFTVVRPLPPTSLSQLLWWLRWHIVLDHQSKVTEPWSAPPILIQFQQQPYLPLQPLSSLVAPVLYWSHNLIKHVSLKMQFPPHQHRARALCSSCARRVIDLVRLLLAGSSSPPPHLAIFSLLPASPPAASHHSTLKQTLPTLWRPAKHTSPPSVHSAKVHLLLSFHRCPCLWLNEVQGSTEPLCTHRCAHAVLMNTHKRRAQKHTPHSSTGICPPSKPWQQRPRGTQWGGWWVSSFWGEKRS